MDTACYGDRVDDPAHGRRVYVSTAGAVYQPRQKHDQKFVFDGALAPADNSASDCRVRRAGGGILLCPAESADSDSAGVWHDCLSKVLPASARV